MIYHYLSVPVNLAGSLFMIQQTAQKVTFQNYCIGVAKEDNKYLTIHYFELPLAVAKNQTNIRQ